MVWGMELVLATRNSQSVKCEDCLKATSVPRQLVGNAVKVVSLAVDGKFGNKVVSDRGGRWRWLSFR